MTLQLQGSCIQRWEVIEYIKKKEKKRKVEVLEYFERLSTWRSEGKLHISKASTHYLSYLHRLGSKSHKILLWFSNKRVEPAVRLYLHGGNAKTMSKERGALSYT